MIGELHATYAYPDDATAAAAFERARSRTRWISVNRWALDSRDVLGRQAVTVLAEDEDPSRPNFDKACEILATDGTLIEAPASALTALRAKRARQAEDGRHIRVRYPAGSVLAQDGTNLGPLRRPQG